jgi:hypothetical protein
MQIGGGELGGVGEWKLIMVWFVSRDPSSAVSSIGGGHPGQTVPRVDVTVSPCGVVPP